MARPEGRKSVSKMANANEQFELGLEAFAGLLDEFRRGNIADRRQKQALDRHLAGLCKRWDQRFPGFPQERFAYASARGVCRRGVRDAYLKTIIVRLLEAEREHLRNRTVVNPVCVTGRHARDLAGRLRDFKVIATDIFPWSNWLYERVRLRRGPNNYEFQQDDIFEPKAEAAPAAVVFFGACGSLSDAAMDYAIQSHCPDLMCRTCCHDNIGGNTRITKRLTLLNLFFQFKNLSYAWAKKRLKRHYFSAKYGAEQYPRSRAARGMSNSNEFLDVSRNSVDSDICRAIIDLDRYLHLAENNYDVWYRGELFVARRDRTEKSHKEA
jgi:hypothetical protein